MSPFTLAHPDTNQHKHMAPQLQDFPDELLVEILGYLPKLDLKSARMTCTRYSHIGAQWLFQRVYFAPRKAAIDTFLNISANHAFARTVTELVYDGRLFLPELTAYKPFKEAFDAYIWDENNGYGFDGDQAGDGTESTVNVDDGIETLSRSATPGWRTIGDEDYHESLANNLFRYTRLFDQQQRILGDRKDYEALLAGLTNLPNITTVIIRDNFSQLCDWTLGRDDQSWYIERSRREINVLAPSQWPRDMLAAAGNEWDVRGIHNLIRAVSVHCQELKELQLASVSLGAPMTVFEMDKDLYDKACTMAQRLTSLTASLYVSRSDSNQDWQDQYDCLQGFLSHAKELCRFGMNGRIDVHLFNNKVWPHLETLNLGDLSLGAAEIKEITQAHKGTLRELTLRNVYMSGEESWCDAAEEIGKYLRLRRVSIFDVCDEVTEEANGNPYLKDETNLAVARSFMQSVPRTTLLKGHSFTIIACPGECPEEGEVGGSH